MTILRNIATGLVKAYIIASLGFSLLVALVALAPLFAVAFVFNKVRKGAVAAKAGAVNVAKRAHARRVVYLHRVLAVVLFAIYPAIFVASALIRAVPEMKDYMRYLRDVFMGRYAY